MMAAQKPDSAEMECRSQSLGGDQIQKCDKSPVVQRDDEILQALSRMKQTLDEIVRDARELETHISAK